MSEEWEPLYDEATDTWIVPDEEEVLLYYVAVPPHFPARFKVGAGRSSRGGWATDAEFWMPLPTPPKVKP